jgi:hypothetical protein
MKKLIFTLLLSITSVCVWAQEAQEHAQCTQETVPPTQEVQKWVHKGHPQKLKATSIMPPNYGSMVIDWGFNFLKNCPSEISEKSWGARIATIGLYYNIRLGHSHFTISPGIGLSFEGYRLQKGYTLKRNATGTVFKDNNPSSIVLSALDVRYLDFCMLEVRFNANSKWPKESFFVALGGKVGWLWKACATVQCKEHNETKECNSWETFNLNGLRYGMHARIGWGRFGLCYTHMLSSLFEEGKGPKKTTANPHSLGLSIDLF